MDCFFVNDLHIDKHLPNLMKGQKHSASYHKWMEQNLLPADVLCIAGDVADNSLVFIDFLAACRGVYKDVIFIYGNHDIGIYDSEYDSVFMKVEKQNKWVEGFKQLSTSTHKFRTHIHKLDGNIINLEERRFVGCMGSADWSYSLANFDTSIAEFNDLWSKGHDCEHWKNWWSSDPIEISVDEKRRLEESIDQVDPHVVITHFAPLGVPVSEQFKDNKLTGMFFWDMEKIINKLPKGCIWHYGHTHAKFKGERNGILFLNNAIGYPGENTNSLGNFTKQDFLINI